MDYGDWIDEHREILEEGFIEHITKDSSKLYDYIFAWDTKPERILEWAKKAERAWEEWCEEQYEDWGVNTRDREDLPGAER